MVVHLSSKLSQSFRHLNSLRSAFPSSGGHAPGFFDPANVFQQANNAVGAASAQAAGAGAGQQAGGAGGAKWSAGSRAPNWGFQVSCTTSSSCALSRPVRACSPRSSRKRLRPPTLNPASTMMTGTTPSRFVAPPSSTPLATRLTPASLFVSAAAPSSRRIAPSCSRSRRPDCPRRVCLAPRCRGGTGAHSPRGR